MRIDRAIRLLVVAGATVLFLVGVSFALDRLAPRIAARFDRDVTVTIPEGYTARQIDALLAEKGITPAGSVTAIAVRDELEGYLFPDTYRFKKGTDPEAAVRRLRETFDLKAGPVLPADPVKAREAVIIGSMLEREVPDPADRRIVAGIIKKRLEIDMRLQIDATICYQKELTAGIAPCYPIMAVDLTSDSPYNTYLYRGLPPGPIGNPGVGALTAALDPQASPYWFYLSDPATSRTIFSRTNEEQEANRAKYLR